MANPHPGNDYYVQPSLGVIQKQDNAFLAGVLTAAGFQGPMSWDQAQTVLALNQKVAQTGAAPIPTTAGQAATGQTGSLPNPLSGLQSIGDFFSRLSQANTWLRVMEVAVGVILLAAGLNAILKQSTGVDVGGTVRKTVKAVR